MEIPKVEWLCLYLAKCKIIENNIKIEYLPLIPKLSQTAVKIKKATNQYTSVGDRRDFGPLKSGSYWYFSPVNSPNEMRIINVNFYNWKDYILILILKISLWFNHLTYHTCYCLKKTDYMHRCHNKTCCKKYKFLFVLIIRIHKYWKLCSLSQDGQLERRTTIN